MTPSEDARLRELANSWLTMIPAMEANGFHRDASSVQKSNAIHLNEYLDRYAKEDATAKPDWIWLVVVIIYAIIVFITVERC